MRSATALTLPILVIGASVAADPSPKASVADFGRFGAVALGMSQEEASSAAGVELTAGYEVPPDEQPCYQLYAKGEVKPKILFMMAHDELVRYDVYDAAIRTAAGVGIGSTEVEIQEAYPGKVSVRPHFYSDGHYLIVAGPDGQKLLFETDGAGVASFRSGREPEVSWVEGCL